MTAGEKSIRILVVDDSQSMRAAAKSVFARDYDFMAVENGLEAIAVMAKFRPHILFVDIVMPKLDGYETVALIRMNDAFRDVPILMMSSKGGVFDVAKGKLLGFDGAIVKPLKSEQLLAAVRDHVTAVEA